MPDARWKTLLRGDNADAAITALYKRRARQVARQTNVSRRPRRPRQSVAEPPFRVELAASFLQKLKGIEAFLAAETHLTLSIDCWASCAPQSYQTFGAMLA